jgi:hypothetical protein
VLYLRQCNNADGAQDSTANKVSCCGKTHGRPFPCEH